ncbi:unnamed protein product [Phytophthora fragariaefolia]|uniref:Unnamed protein product n=1 Tax=Phytophthora fragariaefolia TaxID=1490495 RepID=A0A9W6XJK3_9STRA|nr:unnamed protein product [Phytophthora fragariaefolia]
MAKDEHLLEKKPSSSAAWIETQEQAAHIPIKDMGSNSLKLTERWHEGEDGWRVHFPDHTPSFYFSPFSQAMFDGIMRDIDVVSSKRYPCTATIGKIFGWTVDYAPLTPNSTGTSLVANARFTKLLNCSLDTSQLILPRLEKSLWPLLAAPRSLGYIQKGDSCYQVLQSFHKNAHVIAYNIPCEVNLRYLVLAQHTREVGSDGKRIDKYMMTVADSDANARNRASDPDQMVIWILEGGVCTTITEVDESTVDVVFNQWAGCLSETHGRELYIDWIRFPVRLEQTVSAAKLLPELD